tara:strand:+ start:1108 stop:1971 length:864 start_codon:yes stop_codon:yes gene_type:complete
MLSENQLKRILEEHTKSKLFCKVDKLGASSHRKTYLTNGNGTRYKIRKCFSETDAQDIERRVLDVSHLDIFPRYFGRHDEWIFFEFLDYREAMRDESDTFWYDLGMKIALLETVESPHLDVSFGMEASPIKLNDFQDYLVRCVELLEKTGYLADGQVTALNQRLESIPKTLRNCYGYLDLLPGNIMADDEQIYFVDEEGLAGTIPGLSLIRPLDIWKSYSPPQGINPIERAELLCGYQAGGADSKYFEEYELLLGITYYVLKSADSVSSSGTTNNSIKQLYSRIKLL